MNDKNKLEFKLVPISGVASGNGYRAEFIRRGAPVIGFDDIIEEAQKAEIFKDYSPRLLRSNLEALFENIVTNTLRDGKIRRLDGLVEVSLKIHGAFEKETDDFDPDKHKLELLIHPLKCFNKKPTAVEPVNVNRIKEFRLTSITAADGLHRNKIVVFGQDVVIHGTSLPPSDETKVTFCVLYNDGRSFSSGAEVVSATATTLRCRWPKDFTAEVVGNRLIADVNWSPNPPPEPCIAREIKSSIVSI